MRTLLKMTYILPMLFIGLIIGGAVAGDKPAWVSGLVLLLLDIVVGIALQYYYGGGNANPVTFLRKARKFKKNPYLVQRFSIAQMSAGMINLSQAARVLPRREYNVVRALYIIMQAETEMIPMNYAEFLEAGKILMAQFDLLAPLYKFTGEQNAVPDASEPRKQEYREMAWETIEEEGLASESFKLLSEEFREKFY